MVDDSAVLEAVLAGHQLPHVYNICKFSSFLVDTDTHTLLASLRDTDLVDRFHILLSAQLLDPHQEGVVHEALAGQEVRIALHHSKELLSSILLEVDKGRVLTSSQQEVLIFHCGRVRDFTSHFAIDEASLEVENVLQSVRVFQLQSVFHQHQMHRVRRVRLDSENSKDFREQTVWVTLEVGSHGR